LKTTVKKYRIIQPIAVIFVLVCISCNSITISLVIQPVANINFSRVAVKFSLYPNQPLKQEGTRYPSMSLHINIINDNFTNIFVFVAVCQQSNVICEFILRKWKEEDEEEYE